jgi:hypothetical protein
VNRHRTRGVRSDWIVSGVVRCRCGAALDRVRRRAHRRAGLSVLDGRRAVTRQCAYGGGITKHLLEDAAIALVSKEVGSSVHRRAMTAMIDRVLEASRSVTRTDSEIARDLDSCRAEATAHHVAIEAGAFEPQNLPSACESSDATRTD